VTRALFLTHTQDPAIPDGEGYLYLATANGTNPSPDVALQVLEAVGQIPCAGMPLVSARAPRVRDFRVDARLSMEKGARPQEVAVFVRNALEAAFHPADTSAYESVQFGYYDRKLRWRVAATISQTGGVRSYELTVDGKDDVTLAPTELAHLTDVSLSDAETGE